MVRYKIDPRSRVVLCENENFTGWKVEIHGTDHHHPAHVFVDILGENATSYRLRVFLLDGDVLVGWFLGKILEGTIIIHNQHLLFDGRFNSDRIGGQQ
jgi:metallophosphoesterase superfamily enzyme